MKKLWVLMLVFALAALPATAKEDTDDDADTGKDKKPMSAATFKGLEWRNIGPAFNSGRVVDFAVDPDAHNIIYAATASGGLWKTVNSGTIWEPIFDKEKSYSIGCVTLDPSNANVVWVGTGENNSQRSVAFGDGVSKSLDGGQNWKNVGLEKSEHIGMIVVDPRDSDVVYVAAQGPLWASGGDRGVYKTTDGGATWERVLFISDDTGVNEVHMDPRNPDVLYASSYQRRRHVYTLVNGGPESAIYKSTDAGATWRKITEGLPKVDMGKIGMDISPADPDVLYAVIEAQRDKGGFFRSTDRGESWSKMSDYVSGSPQYYNEIFADPNDVDRVYAMDTFLQITLDGGKTFNRVGEKKKHVDNHALWIDPRDTDHLLVGCDGGIYETWDRGATYRFFENLPITQFYRVSVDNTKPFYYVYGGTQDNNSLGGPSRTLYSSGISNEDWFVTVGGDGYETVVDPTDPEIVYSQWQYGGLVRYDRASGEAVDIQPQEEPGEAAHRWNWDSPLMISPHLHTRLYFACQRLFRSDDRGNSWTAVSPDLSRAIDPNTLPVFGKIQSIDAVAKNMSTSNYGNIVALSESPLVEGLIYVGTDDGLIQVTENGGADWRAVDQVRGVPSMTYVSRLEASVHDEDTVYATFNNKKRGDFKPYVFVSRDRGRTWSSITGDLPDREIAYACDAGPRQTGAALCRHRVRRLLHPQRGRQLDQAQGQAPDHPGPRPRHPSRRKRPRARHLRPGLLHPRRLLAAARGLGRRPRAGGDPLPHKKRAALRGKTFARRRPRRHLLHRRQSGFRRHLHLLPEGRAQDSRGPTDRGREGGRQGRDRPGDPQLRRVAGRGRTDRPLGVPHRSRCGGQRRAQGRRRQHQRPPSGDLGSAVAEQPPNLAQESGS